MRSSASATQHVPGFVRTCPVASSTLNSASILQPSCPIRLERATGLSNWTSALNFNAIVPLNLLQPVTSSRSLRSVDSLRRTRTVLSSAGGSSPYDTHSVEPSP